MENGIQELRESLSDYVLRNVEKTNEWEASGSYGKVETVEINKLRCALKTLHSHLVQDLSVHLRHFVRECRVLSKMKHPNVVQFLGLHFSRDSSVPGLVMEWLPYSLPSFLEHCQERKMIPLSKEMAYGILFDIAKGMHYLHDQNIIHRDLSPKNILLSSGLVAKVADLGVIKIIDPLKTARTCTAGPGTPLITAPEAAEGTCSYGTPIDVFAFGILVLMVAKGDWPATPKADKVLVNPKERWYRMLDPLERYEDEIDRYVPRGDALREWIEGCLQAKPDDRPTSWKLVSAFSKLSNDFPSPINDVLDLLRSRDESRKLTKEKGRMETELKQLRERGESVARHSNETNSLEEANNESEFEKLFQGKERLQEEMAELRKRYEALKGELDRSNQNQRTTRLRNDEAVAELRKTIKALEEELKAEKQDSETARLEEEQQHRQLRRQVDDLRRNVDEMEEECGDLRRNVTEVEEERNDLQQQVEDLRRDLEEVEEQRTALEQQLFTNQQKLRDFNDLSIRGMSQSLGASVSFPSLVLPPTLSKDEVMPLVDNDNARLRIKEVRQSTVSLPHIKGAQAVIILSKVYVGHVSPSIWVYDVIARSWDRLPREAPVRNYALANFQDQLALLGGSGNTRVSRQVYIWSQGAWDPGKVQPMLEERENPVAVGYAGYLVVMGGSAAKLHGLITSTLRSIEVFHPDKDRWQVAAPLPRASFMLQSVSQDGFLYILSSDGWTVRYCSLADLVHSSEVKSKGSPWKSIARSVPHTRCCIAVFDKTLLVIAGAGSDGSVYAYDPKNTRWQKTSCLSSLPAIKNACCVPVAPKELFLCGGDIDLMTDLPQSAYSLILDEVAP